MVVIIYADIVVVDGNIVGVVIYCVVIIVYMVHMSMHSDIRLPKLV